MHNCKIKSMIFRYDTFYNTLYEIIATSYKMLFLKPIFVMILMNCDRFNMGPMYKLLSIYIKSLSMHTVNFHVDLFLNCFCIICLYIFIIILLLLAINNEKQTCVF